MAMNPDVSQSSDALLTIGQLAEQCDITVRTLRYYEDLDLITPVARSKGKYRLYNENSLKRLRAVLALQDLGFSLDDVRETLGADSAVKEFSKSERVTHTASSLKRLKNTVDQKLHQLQAFKDDVLERVDTLESACRPCVTDSPHSHCPSDCQYIDVHQ